MNKALGRTDCCTRDGRRFCSSRVWPPFCSHDVEHQRTCSAPLSYAEIREQIYCNRSPVAYTIFGSSDPWSAHIRLAFGYDDAGRVIESVDPLSVTLGVPEVNSGPYSEFYVGLPPQTHGDDFSSLAINRLQCIPRSCTPAPSPADADETTDPFPWLPLPTFPVPEHTAKEALDLFRKTLDRRTAKLHGFRNLSEAVGPLEIGLPLARTTVRVSKLPSAAQDGLRELFDSELRWITPLKANGKVRSSIIYARSGDIWKPESFGSAVSIRVLETERMDAVRRHGLRPEAVFLVAMPGLNRSFLGTVQAGDLRLIPLADDPAGRFRKRELLDSKVVFQWLARDAAGIPIKEVYPK